MDVTPLLKKLIGLVVVLLVVMVGLEQYRKMTAPTVPDFSGTTLKGETFNLAEHRGKRPVLISFYATWCGPCQMEVEHLLKFAREYGERGLQIVILTEEPPSVITGHPVMARAPFTIIADAQKTFKEFGITALPHSFFLKPNGQVLEMEGYSDTSMRDLEYQVKEAVAVASANK